MSKCADYLQRPPRHLVEQHSLSNVHNASLGRQVSPPGSVSGAQVGPQQSSDRSQLGRLWQSSPGSYVPSLPRASRPAALFVRPGNCPEVKPEGRTLPDITHNRDVPTCTANDAMYD